MFTGEPCVTNHRLQMNIFQTACFSHPIAFHDMFEDGNNGFFGQPRIEKNRTAMLRKAFFTNQTIQQPRFVRPVCGANPDIFFAPNTVLGAMFILTAKLIQFVHDSLPDSKILDGANVT